MAFVSEKINGKEDKDYFGSIALKSMTGQVLYPDWWMIDRERDISRTKDCLGGNKLWIL